MRVKLRGKIKAKNKTLSGYKIVNSGKENGAGGKELKT